MKSKIVLTLVLYWFFSSSAQSQVLSRVGSGPALEELGSDEIQILSEIRKSQSWWFTKVLKHAESGARLRAVREECSGYSFEKIILQSRKALQNHFESCEKELLLPALSSQLRLAWFMSSTYKIGQHRQIREVRLKLPDGVIRRGLLALKTHGGRRPLILFQCGIPCQINEPEVRLLLMHLFDATPFHVLVLGTFTSADYIEDNKIVNIGGFHEAIEIHEVARLLRRPDQPISRWISHVHLLGASLGGHAVLYASLYSRVSNNFDSVFAMCPVVDLRKAVLNLSHGSPLARAFGRRTWEILWPWIQRLDPEFARQAGLGSDRLEEVISRMVEYRYVPRFEKEPWLPAPLDTEKVIQAEDFWRINDFTHYADKVRTPVFVWGSFDDPIVLVKDHSMALADTRNPYFEFLLTSKGHHCAASAFYGWDIVSSILRGYFASYSGDWIRTQVRKTMSLALPKSVKIYQDETFYSFEWTAQSGTPALKLDFKIWSPWKKTGNLSCRSWNPAVAFEGCFRRVNTRISFESFEGLALWIPQTSAEAHSLTRWANQNLKVLTGDRRLLFNSRTPPAYLSWKTNSY